MLSLRKLTLLSELSGASAGRQSRIGSGAEGSRGHPAGAPSAPCAAGRKEVRN